MKIFYRKKETKNLGNYENITLEIGVEDEVNFEIETYESCYTRLKAFIDEKLKEELEKASITLDGVKAKIVNLINLSPANRLIIKEFLELYNVTKVTDLSSDQLVEFNNKLKTIGN